MSKPTSRREAKLLGEKLYFTGNPCPKSHNTDRYTSNGTCADCLAEQAKSKEKKMYDQQYYIENKERISVRGQKYHLRNRRRNNENAKQWALNNKDKRRIISKTYKAIRRTWELSGVSSKELNNWVDMQDKVCFWCDCSCDENYHIDHYFPLSKGGAHSLDNLVISCPSCNLKKSAKDPIEFAKSIGRVITSPDMLKYVDILATI